MKPSSSSLKPCRRLDLDFIMKFFLFVTGALLAAYMASLIFQLMYTAREQFAPSEASIPGLDLFYKIKVGLRNCRAYGVWAL